MPESLTGPQYSVGRMALIFLRFMGFKNETSSERSITIIATEVRPRTSNPMVDLASVPALVRDDLVVAVNEDLIDRNLPVEDPPLVPPPSDDSDWTSSPAGKEFRSSFLFQSSCYLPGDDDATESETSYSQVLSPLQGPEYLRPPSRSQTFSSGEESTTVHSSLRKPKDALSPIADEHRHVAFCDELIFENGQKEEKAHDDDTDCGESSLHQRGFRIIVPLHHAFGSLPPAPLNQYNDESYTVTSIWKEDDEGLHSRTGVSTLTHTNESKWPSTSPWFPKFRRKQLICIASLALFVAGLLIIALSCGKGGCRRSEAAATPSPSPPLSTSFHPASTQAPQALPADILVLQSTPELYDAVDRYLSSRFGAAHRSRHDRLLLDESEIVPPIGRWDVRDVTNFTSVFDVRRNPFAAQFNDDLHLWDVSNGITMENMFYGAELFNGDISSWNTSRVVNMKDMFAMAMKFNGNLSFWDVSRVTTMEGMFRRTRVFNGNLKRWQTSSVTSMAKMFQNSFDFTGDGLDAWDTSSVTDMSYMFRFTPSFNGDLSNWNVSKVTNMRAMFQEAIAFNSDLSNWDVSRVTDISQMFMHAVRFKADLSAWQTSSIVNAAESFFGAFSFNGDVSQWDVRNLMDLTKMFAGAINFKNDLCSWEILLPSMGKARTRNMFVATSCPVTIYPPADPLEGISFCFPCEYSTVVVPSNGTDGDNIFNNNETASSYGDLLASGGPFSILSQQELYTAVDSYLRNSSNTTEVALKYGYPIGSWNVSRVVNFSSTFDADRNPLAAEFSEDLNDWDTSSALSMSRMFAGASLFNGNISSWSTSRVTSMDAMFLNAYSFNGDLGSWDTSSCTNMASMFEAADLFNGNLLGFSTSRVVDMTSMFASAISFEGAGLQSWDTSATTSMKALFSETFSFNRRNALLSWDVSNVVDISGIFQFSSFDGNISDWNVGNVRDFQYAFSGAGSFNYNLAPWNVSQGTNFNGMFAGAKGFNQGLCDWVPQIIVSEGVTSSGMFVSTACLNTNDPNLGDGGPVASMCSDCIVV